MAENMMINNILDKKNVFCSLQYFQCYQSLDAVVSWMKPQLDEHREKFDPDNVHDFIDAYLAAARNLAKNGDCNTSLTGDHVFPVLCLWQTQKA